MVAALAAAVFRIIETPREVTVRVRSYSSSSVIHFNGDE
jgi:hypothetical protein